MKISGQAYRNKQKRGFGKESKNHRKYNKSYGRSEESIHTIMTDIAEDVEYVEIKEFNSSSSTSSGKIDSIEQQVIDVEWEEIS